MKKFLNLLIALLAFPAFAAAQEGTVTLTTNLEAGTEITLRVWTSSVNDPLTIDWGDGNAKSYTIDPNGWAWTLNTKGNVLGPTITITGSLANLECSSAGITACAIENQPNLKYINLSKNALTELTLPSLPALETLDLSENQIDSHSFDISAVGSTLKELNVSKNGENFITLNLMGFTALESFYGYNNPEMTTVVFADNADNLKRIDMHECHIMHFYSRSMPNLVSLNLNDNALLDFEDGNYPALTYFYIANNYLTELDITKYPKLYQFTCAGNDITTINPSNCPELISFNISGNKIKTVDLSNNKAITNLYVQDNQLTKIDFIGCSNIQYVNVSNNPVTFVDLTNAYYLRSFEAAGTQCEFFYFNYVNPYGRFNTVDMRNNVNMTSASLSATFKTMPCISSGSGNVYIEGSNGEHSNTSYLTGIDMGWTVDVAGDGTATNDDLNVTVDATNTGETVTVTGQYGGMVADQTFTFTKYATDHGTFTLAQWSGGFYQQLADVTTTAKLGVPIVVTATAEEGYRFKGVTVNGKLITDPWFVINEDAAIAVVFEPLERSFSFTCAEGQELSFALYGVDASTTVGIDWGNGSFEQKEVGTYARIDGTSVGTTVTISGDVIGANFESYGEYGYWMGLPDNQITGFDFSGNSALVSLNLYMNPIETLDVSNLADLRILDCSYCELNDLDVSHNPLLGSLSCYGNYLATLNLEANTLLEELNAKNNSLTTIDLSKAPSLYYLDLTNNQFASIDLAANTKLETLNIGGNQLSTIDLSHQPDLLDLSVTRNSFTTLDLSANKALRRLLFNNNAIHSLDLSELKYLSVIDMGGNGMTACELDDFYFGLPEWYPLEEGEAGNVSTTLTLLTGTEETPNDADNSDTLIATEKGWTVNRKGNASGCDVARVIIEPTTNGTIALSVDGNTINSGDKVKKNVPITVTAVADPEYRLGTVTANGKEVVDGTFKIARLTRVIASFIKDGAVDSIALDGVSISGKAGAIDVVAPADASVEVYTTSGSCVYSGNFDGKATISLARGVYAVRVATDQGSMARIIAVR